MRSAAAPPRYRYGAPARGMAACLGTVNGAGGCTALQVGPRCVAASPWLQACLLVPQLTVPITAYASQQSGAVRLPAQMQRVVFPEVNAGWGHVNEVWGAGKGPGGQCADGPLPCLRGQRHLGQVLPGAVGHSPLFGASVRRLLAPSSLLSPLSYSHILKHTLSPAPRTHARAAQVRYPPTSGVYPVPQCYTRAPRVPGEQPSQDDSNTTQRRAFQQRCVTTALGAAGGYGGGAGHARAGGAMP